MADPLTITSGVLRIVLSCIKGIQIAKEYVDKYNNAELKLIALSVNCEAVHEALTQIRDLFLSDNIQPMLRNRDASSQESFETLERVIGNCSVVFAVLHQRLEPLLLPTFNKENAVSKKSKIAAVWNDSSIDFLVDLSKGLTPAVQLLFTAFQACVFLPQAPTKAKRLHSIRKNIKLTMSNQKINIRSPQDPDKPRCSHPIPQSRQ